MATDEAEEAHRLRERVDQLEDRLDSLTQADDVAVDEDGRRWSLGDLMNIGLTRREAMLAMSALVGGAALPYAISSAVTTSANAQTGAVGQIGTDTERVDVFGATVDTESLDTDDGTIGGLPILNGPSSGSSTGLAVGGGWTVVDSSQPTIICLSIQVETDGNSNGRVDVEIDESGGTSRDYRFLCAADSLGGSGFIQRSNVSFYLPAGAAVNLNNQSDPSGNNSVTSGRKYVISS